MTPDVVHVQAFPNYDLVAQFASGEARRLNMRAYLQYPAFAALREPAFFLRAHVQHGTVAWNEEIDLAPDTLYLRGDDIAAPFSAAQTPAPPRQTAPRRSSGFG